MADRPASERTEKPTPDRLKKAREEGQLPESQEVPSALMIGMLLVAMSLGGSWLLGRLVEQVRSGLALQTSVGGGPEVLSGALRSAGGAALMLLLPFLLAAASVSVLSSLLIGGWAMAPKAMRLRWDRLAPGQGLRQLVSLRSLMRLVVSLAKAGVIMLIVYFYLRQRLQACLALRWSAPAGLVAAIGQLVLGVMARIVLAMMAIAGLDLLFQRWRYARDLRMTRQEVKEERRQHELAPEVRGRIRAVQVEMVRRRMLQDVPQADVVVSNPTHLAVALKYEPGSMDAPKVVAKGGDLLCEKIKEIARTHGVPIVYRPELARALYANADVGQMIPETLFVAVAEVLAMIYRLRRKRLTASAGGSSA